MATKRGARRPAKGPENAPARSKKTGHAGRPTVSIVGAGRLGAALALALSQCGYQVEALVSRKESHAERAARLIHTTPLSLSDREIGRLPRSRLLFITTPDDLIEETAARIADAAAGEKSEQRTALHASGALSSGVLKRLRDVGFRTGSMHPLVSVSEAVAGAESLRRAFFCIEGEARAVSDARRIVRDLGGRSFSIDTAMKALYHAAAVTSSGHMVALFDIATEMLGRCGLKEKEARSILMPLVESTIANLKELGPARALTGTFSRADVETVRRHLQAIRREELADAYSAYRTLGRRSLRLAETRGASREALAVILESLDDAGEE